MLKQLRSKIKQATNPTKAKLLQGFFKTGKGQYGEGDVFLGITVPMQRSLAKKFGKDLSLVDLDILLKSKIHEERLIALLILVDRYQKNLVFEQSREAKFLKSSEQARTISNKQIYTFYLTHTKYINNWDLVDLSAPKIVGAYLHNKNKTILYKLAKSKSLWERRIAILSTFYDIYYKKPDDALKIATILLYDSHDLIHKAVGWMLREVGKRCDEQLLLNFLNQNGKKMPRTMLRYAIERLPEKTRLQYLHKSSA